MKKIVTSLCASMLAIAAWAQSVGEISPSTMNVYTPDVYEYVSVTYSDSLTLSSAVATVSYGDSVRTLTPDSVSTKALRALFNITPAVVSLGVPEGGVITVSAGSGANATAVSANYKYYAESPKPASITPADSILSSKAADITFKFSQPMSCQYIGFESGSSINIDSIGAVLVDSVTAHILTSYWDSTSTKLTVSLDGVKDAAGYSYPIYKANYYYAADVASYLGATPDPATSTYQDAYDAWNVGFMFDKQVEMPESGTAATVKFCNEDDEIIATIELEEGDVEVTSVRGKYYVVNVLVPDIPTSATDFSHAVFQLQGFTYGGLPISQPSATYYVTLSSSAKTARSNATTNISDAIAVDASKSANVYSVQGTLVKANASNLNGLAKGVYIVNGKKYVAK